MQVVLTPHVGQHLATKKEVDLNQDRIFVDGNQVGFVARKPDSPICLLRPDFDQELKDAVEAAVRAKYGDQPRKIAEPVPIPEEDLDDDDDLAEYDDE